MTKSKDNKRRRAELLGMPVGTAEKHLRKSIIHELARQLGKNRCCRCSLEIQEPDDLAIVHVQDWEEEPDLYWALNNIAFSHATCEAARSGKRQREKKQMSKVEVRVEDTHGKSLPGTRHEGDLYVAGKKGARYNVRVRNKTGNRILVVVTVDGRNVITGKPGDHHDSGHVLEAHQSWTFKGWRTSDEEVAAFRFGGKKGSYSSQMGTPENVGVIGVAVFEEDRPAPNVITVKETTYIPYPVSTTPVVPYTPYGPTWTVTNDNTTFGMDSGIAPMNGSWSSGGGTYGSWSSGGGTYGSTVSSSTLSMNTSVQEVRPTSNVRGSTPGRQRKTVTQQRLGTEFGEQLSSKVRKTEFKRATDDPCEVWVVHYDSMGALRERGIMVRRPSQQTKPQAFPENDGYCQPPGGVRFEKNKTRYR